MDYSFCGETEEFDRDGKVGGSDNADKDLDQGINVLGADQVLAILEHLPVPCVLAFGMTCRRFNELANSDALWALICRREWGSSAVDAWPSSGNNGDLRWKDLHRQMLALGSVTWHRLHQGDIVPAARASHSMVTTSEKIIIFGGGHDGGRHLDDTWMAPVPADTTESVAWQQTSVGIPGGRFGQSCTIVDDTLVLFGGINDHGTRQSDTWISKGVNQQNASFWQLLEVAAAPCARGAHAGCYGGENKVVVYGGIGSDGIRLDDTWLLDLSEKPLPAWRRVNTFISPPARSGHTLTWIGGKCMILFGGRGTKFEVLNDVWLLDMEGDLAEWVELRASELHPKHSVPPPRAGHSATLIFGGRVLIYGGEDGRRCRKGDVWVLDPSAGNPVRNVSTSVGFSCRKMTKSHNKYDRKFWKKLKQWGQSPSKRSFHGASPAHSGRSVLIFGGMVDGEPTPSASAGLVFDAELYLLQLAP
eukprot:c20506_g1_i1 orf=667-2088(+)